MKKITDKVGSKICRDTDFLTRLNGVVWDDDLEPGEFEEKWLKVMNDFSLEDNTWLNGKFTDRHTWIPAYFRNVPMGGLLRTTQRSESANSFFKRFENKYGTLTEFLVKLSINTCSLVGYTPPDPVTNFEVSLVEDAKKGLKFAVECSRSTNDVRKEESDVREFAKLIKEFRTKLEGNTQPLTKLQQIELLLGRKVLEETNILPPNVSRNKGRGKRLVSKKNKAIKKAEKAKRLCANCKRKGNHDKRNCPYDFVDRPPVNQGELADEEVEEEGDEDEE
ncbi:uncharacterized protein LOC141590378 [Silene latifolia]|uniref:uncharacterized protein LOC141590378 n=1 Tax=Silene latifolia TaxID=37657 RepID=UPI003D773F68